MNIQRAYNYSILITFTFRVLLKWVTSSFANPSGSCKKDFGEYKL